ncbi:MAG: DUF1559 domain-containing protein [Phycisphaerales bacterium]|nr:DUF1559 domain-containing protein [Phycisphaerales bacterium]
MTARFTHTQAGRPDASGRPAFTLIELLVVISIIALLIALLLPGLAQAREASKKTACLSNQRQLALAFTLYALDFGQIPGCTSQGRRDNLDWSGEENRRPLNSRAFPYGRIYPYVSKSEQAVECPKARRQANKEFDYTFVAGMAGARLDIPWRTLYPADPRSPGRDMLAFQAMPVLIEEDEIWYNNPVPDGTWANLDQFSDRHGGTCNLAYLDGSGGPFKSPKGPDPAREEPQDLKSIHLLVETGPKTRVVGLFKSDFDKFGWINRPRSW